MIPYARLTPGPGFSPMRAAAYYGQRLVVMPGVRALATHAIAALINARQGRKPVAVTPALTQALATLRADGLLPLPSYPVETIDRLMARLKTEHVIDAKGAAVPLDALAPGTAAAAYPLKTVLALPELFEIVNNPFVLDLAAAYLGCRPTLSSLGIRWSLPAGGGGNDVQHFHRDMDDWRSVKFFVYLTDVARDTGPHMYVRGSHRTQSRLRARPYSLAEVTARFGADAMTSITGARGTAFLADVYGIHRGAPPVAGPRLILQMQYSVLPIYAFAYRPVAAALPEGSDPYMYRLLVH